MPERLPPHPRLKRRPGPLVLCVMDGVGLGNGGPDDAVSQAHTPNLDRLLATCPWTALQAHGTAVGMPTNKDLGNSEVGHNAMGAGRVFDQGAKLVDHALDDGSAFEGDVWKSLTQGKTLHLIGLVSDGNVHSHIRHLHILIERAAKDGVARLRVHVLTDGRDVPGRSALTWVEPLEAALARHQEQGRDYRIASGGGRMHITMDRYEADWEMVERGWRTHVLGQATPFSSASDAIRHAYEAQPDIDDQFIPAFVVTDASGEACGPIEDGDSVLFFNFRGDRAVEISRAFDQADFPHFNRERHPDVFYAGMMQYDGDLGIPHRYLVSPPVIERTVPEYLATAGFKTFACSETQKFGHVTYFFNGNRAQPFDRELEHYVQVASDPHPFQERPWMKAAEITDAVVEAIESGIYDHVRLNYANGDMVGHTGHLEATRMSVEAVDLQLARLEKAVRAADGILLVTADHGNADEMWDRAKGEVVREDDGRPKPKTSHTVNQVPFIVVDPRGALDVQDVTRPGLANIGSTLLELMGFQPPDDFVPGLVGEA